jgi:predicted dehydrogenase
MAPSTAASRARIVGSNAAMRIGVVGLHGRGGDHVAGFRAVPQVKVTALCDVDSAVLDRHVAEFKKTGDAPAAFTDVRKLLASGLVDAISVATPNHWHALLGVWAAEHGLHAYIEKPISHDVWEGSQLVAAAHKHRVVIACGSQCRSNPGMQQVIAFARSGALGRLRLARGLCYKRRKSIGPVPANGTAPATVDYDLWLGPAAQQPVRRQQFHYDWHWQWDFGNGDLGNQGVHQMDLCRWAIGSDKLPAAAMAFGGRFGYQDAGETPNTQIVWLDCGDVPIVFEVRGLPLKQGVDQLDKFLGADVGVVLHLEGGCVVIKNYQGGTAFDQEGKVVQQFDAPGDHFANFAAAVAAGDMRQLTADVNTGHLSAAYCHLGNDSYRAGTDVTAAALSERLRWEPSAHEAFLRTKEHLELNGIAFGDAAVLRLGRFLRPDPDCSKHARRDYRKPFELSPQA